MRIKRTAGWDKTHTHTHTNPLTIWDHNQNLKENRCGTTSVWNATGPQHLFLFSHLFIYLLIVSSEPLWRQSLSFGERQKVFSTSTWWPAATDSLPKISTDGSFFRSLFFSPLLSVSPLNRAFVGALLSKKNYNARLGFSCGNERQ